MKNNEKEHWVVAKLGGSNMKTADDLIASLETLISLSKSRSGSNFVFVFSALFNLTNELEVLASLRIKKDIFGREKRKECTKRLDDFISTLCALKKLTPEESSDLASRWNARRRTFEKILQTGSDDNDDKFRDLVLSEGESLTLFIINMFLPFFGLEFTAIDPKEMIKTDNNFGNAEILFEKTKELVLARFTEDQPNSGKVFITAGYIGSTMDGITTTVGREGSDYIAAILAKMLKADYLYFFKDVGAIFDSMESRQKIKKMSYEDLRLKIEKEKFKAIHPKVANCLNGENITVLIANPKTGEIGTTITPS